jgi:hypothetical protein
VGSLGVKFARLLRACWGPPGCFSCARVFRARQLACLLRLAEAGSYLLLPWLAASVCLRARGLAGLLLPLAAPAFA